MTLINCEVNLILNFYTQCIILSNALEAQATTFAVTDAKSYVRAVAISTQN